MCEPTYMMQDDESYHDNDNDNPDLCDHYYESSDGSNPAAGYDVSYHNIDSDNPDPDDYASKSNDV